MYNKLLIMLLMTVTSSKAMCLSLAPLDLPDYCRESNFIALVTIENGSLPPDKSALYSASVEVTFKDERAKTEMGKNKVSMFGRYFVGDQYYVFLKYDTKETLSPTGIVDGGRMINVNVVKRIIHGSSIEDVIELGKDDVDSLEAYGLVDFGRQDGRDRVYRASDFSALLDRISKKR